MFEARLYEFVTLSVLILASVGNMLLHLDVQTCPRGGPLKFPKHRTPTKHASLGKFQATGSNMGPRNSKRGDVLNNDEIWSFVPASCWYDFLMYFWDVFLDCFLTFFMFHSLLFGCLFKQTDLTKSAPR